MKEDLLMLMRNRRSVRSYTSAPIEGKLLEQILEIGRLSPSACNQQGWEFHLVHSPEARQELCTCYERPWFAEAQAYIVVVAKPSEAWTFLDKTRSALLIDSGIASTQMMLAAEALGLSTTWVCAFDRQKCAQVLGLDFLEQEPISILALGYTEQEYKASLPCKRKAAEEVIFRH